MEDKHFNISKMIVAEVKKKNYEGIEEIRSKIIAQA